MKNLLLQVLLYATVSVAIGCQNTTETSHFDDIKTTTPQHLETAKEHESSHLHAEDLERYGVTFGRASSREIRRSQTAPAVVSVNNDTVAHVVPRVSGIATQVLAGLGEEVQRGDTLAIISSLDLASAKSGLFTAQERLRLENQRLNREESLRLDGI